VQLILLFKLRFVASNNEKMLTIVWAIH